MNSILNTGKIIALSSFVIGTSFLSFYLYFGEEYVNIYLAFLFVVGALIVNTVILSVIIGRTILNTLNRQEAFKTIGVMLLNIPISIIYFYMILNFPYKYMT